MAFTSSHGAEKSQGALASKQPPVYSADKDVRVSAGGVDQHSIDFR